MNVRLAIGDGLILLTMAQTDVEGRLSKTISSQSGWSVYLCSDFDFYNLKAGCNVDETVLHSSAKLPGSLQAEIATRS